MQLGNEVVQKNYSAAPSDNWTNKLILPHHQIIGKIIEKYSSAHMQN